MHLSPAPFHFLETLSHLPLKTTKQRIMGKYGTIENKLSEWIQLKWLNFMFFHANAKVMWSVNVKVLLLTACSLPVFQTITYKVMTFHGDMRICLLHFVIYIYSQILPASFQQCTVHFCLSSIVPLTLISSKVFFFFLSGTPTLYCHCWDLLTLITFAKTYIL